MLQILSQCLESGASAVLSSALIIEAARSAFDNLIERQGVEHIVVVSTVLSRETLLEEASRHSCPFLVSVLLHSNNACCQNDDPKMFGLIVNVFVQQFVWNMNCIDRLIFALCCRSRLVR